MAACCATVPRTTAAGFATPSLVVGSALGLLVIVSALTLTQGLMRLSDRAITRAERRAGALWALDRVAHDVSAAGIGVCPGGEPDCPDEAIELLAAGALGIRGDLDRDDAALRAVPERDLAGKFSQVATANDEVVVYLRRAGTRQPATRFEADLDSPDRVTQSDGTLLARRDGIVEAIDAGPSADPATTARGTLYRVTFIDDARWAGTGRFRVVEPLLDDVVGWQVRAYDANGAQIAACGGLDDTASRSARARVRRLVVELTVADRSGAPLTLRRELTPALAATVAP